MAFVGLLAGWLVGSLAKHLSYLTTSDFQIKFDATLKLILIAVKSFVWSFQKLLKSVNSDMNCFKSQKSEGRIIYNVA